MHKRIIKLQILTLLIIYISNVYGAEAINDTHSNLKIIFIDVGQGSSILIIMPNGKSMLIDGGEKEEASTVLAKIRKEKLNSIDIVVATHPHSDHIGGLIGIMKNITVKQVLDSGQVHTTKTFNEYLEIIETKDIPLDSVKKGDIIRLDTNVHIEVLNPSQKFEGVSDADEFNNNSVVIKISYNNFTAIFPADIERETEMMLVKAHNNGSINLDADLLLVPHQGSETSSTKEFLNAISPEVVIISVGNNVYGHPHPEVVEQIKAFGAHIFRTDIDGSITVITDGQTYNIVTDKTAKTITIPEFGTVLFISISTIILIGIIRVMGWRSLRQL